MSRQHSIPISEKYGVNPCIPLCWFCNEPKNEVILAGRLPGDVEAPRHAVWDRRPCDNCQKCMRLGIICISVREEKNADKENPYRTGGWCVLTEEAFRRVFEGLRASPEIVEDSCKKRCCFLSDKVWDLIGLPRGRVEGVPDNIEDLKETPQ